MEGEKGSVDQYKLSEELDKEHEDNSALKGALLVGALAGGALVWGGGKFSTNSEQKTPYGERLDAALSKYANELNRIERAYNVWHEMSTRGGTERAHRVFGSPEGEDRMAAELVDVLVKIGDIEQGIGAARNAINKIAMENGGDPNEVKLSFKEMNDKLAEMREKEIAEVINPSTARSDK